MPKSACRTLLPLSVALSILSGVGLVAPIHATLAPQLSLNDLTRAADAIVIATATRTESLWVDGDLVTRVTLDVEEALQGALSNPIHVIVLGGIDVNRRIPVASVVPGQPRIRQGDRMLLFLRALPPRASEFGLVGDAQGRFVLLPHSPGSVVAARDLTDVHLVDEDRVRRGGTTTIPLDLLVERIRTLLNSDAR